MYCKNCGKQLSDGMRYCPNCGTDNGIRDERKLTKLFLNKNKDAGNTLNISGKKSSEEEVDGITREGDIYATAAVVLIFISVLLTIFVPIISIVCVIIAIVLSIVAAGKTEKGSKGEKMCGYLVAIEVVLVIVLAIIYSAM